MVHNESLKVNPPNSLSDKSLQFNPLCIKKMVQNDLRISSLDFTLYRSLYFLFSLIQFTVVDFKGRSKTLTNSILTKGDLNCCIKAIITLTIMLLL